MTDLTRLPLRGQQQGSFNVVVESPRGSTVKLKYEPSLGAFMLSRPLTRGLRYPFDWGFIPSTKGPDGDPLDALVYWDDTTWPGVVLPCRPLGLLRVEQKKRSGKPGERERNDRILLVPVAAARAEHLTDHESLSQRERDELEHFFLAAVAFADKDARMQGWEDAAAASRMIEQYSLPEK